MIIIHNKRFETVHCFSNTFDTKITIIRESISFSQENPTQRFNPIHRYNYSTKHGAVLAKHGIREIYHSIITKSSGRLFS
jgi:hypothetical protein